MGVVVLFLALSSNVQRNSHNPVALLLWVYKHEGTHDDNADDDDDDMSISNTQWPIFFQCNFFFVFGGKFYVGGSMNF